MGHFGQLVRQARLKHNLTQRETASKLGYSTVSFINKVEKGTSGVIGWDLKAWSQVLKVPVKNLKKKKVADYKSKVLAQVK